MNGLADTEAGPSEGLPEKKKIANGSKRNTTLFGVISGHEEVHGGTQFWENTVNEEKNT